MTMSATQGTPADDEPAAPLTPEGEGVSSPEPAEGGDDVTPAQPGSPRG